MLKLALVYIKAVLLHSVAGEKSPKQAPEFLSFRAYVLTCARAGHPLFTAEKLL